ncbi:nicotinate-nucleotide--dimethylbenzimidazole phosphoribosyltransferase [Streptomyces sp. NPDC048506]|uniref:nicotinate-nucleotide--dimethylbenzimidazole phosphoribosyltransferase n=1 Tax=Streptomyces sp. NPDC048506 TaxID=3155028 RepID=UPI00342C675E
MTDTGRVPGEGQPENAGGHPGQPQPAASPTLEGAGGTPISAADAAPTELPGMVAPPGEYPYVDQADGIAEDDDLLLMPGAQGAWSEQPAPQPFAQETHQGPTQQPQPGAQFDAAAPVAAGFEPLPAQPGDHESGGRDSGSVDLSAVRIPQPAAPQPPDRARAAAPSPSRRPLHLGPPVPDATGGVVRSLADRGPADAPAQAPARPAGPPTGGPEYFDAPAEGPQDPETVTPGQPAPGARPAAGAPNAEQPAGDATGAAPTYAAYGEQAYGGQLSAEQTYGAAGQGPLPGPQLGEIPSQLPPWGDQAPAQAAQAPVAEPVAPVAPVAEAVAQGAVQDAVPPAEQSPATPLPVADPAAQDPAGAVDAAAAAGTVAAPDAAPAAPVDGDPTPAAPTGQPGQEVPENDENHAAQEVRETQQTQETQAGQAGQESAVAPEAPLAEAVEAAEVPVADAPVAEAEALVAEAGATDAVPAPVEAADAPAVAPDAAANEAPEATQQPDAAVVEGPQQPAPDPAAPAAETAAQAQPADAPAAQPVPEAPAPAAAVPDAADAAPAPQDPPTAEQAQPAGQEQPAEEPQAAPAPAEAVQQPQPAQPATPAADPQQPEATAPAPVAAPQGPVAMPAAEGGAPQEQAVIERSEAPQPAAEQPQSGAAVDAAGQQPAEAPASQTAPQTAPQVEDAPAEPSPAAAGDDAPAPADAPAAVADQDTASAVDRTAEQPQEPVDGPQPAEPAADEATPAADAHTVSIHIPAQLTGDQPVAPPAPDTAAPPAAPAAEAPQEQDATELVQLGEGHDEDRPQAADDQQPADTVAADPEGVPAGPPAAGYDDSERAAVHRVMRERRDIRNGFRSDPIPNEVLLRVLEAAHTAPSVGHSQPWDFVVIRSAETREKMHQLAMQQREAYAKSLPKARAKQFRELKIEAILETPVNIVVTADSTRGGRHTLGRHTQPQMAPYSSALAVENLWLAARAEGLGVGWVSFFDEREMVRELGLPEHLEVVAYLCVGYVDEFPDEPELLQAGWSKRRPLSWVVHEETYGRRALPGETPHDLIQETLQGIRPLDAKALGEAWERQKRMTKPAGALGMLEIISAQLCGLSRKCPPPIPEPAAVAIFAGDHGVHAQGVTPWPQEVTGQMVANFLGGGAVCNAFAHQVGAEVCVVDVGVASELPATPGLLPRKVRAGTADFTAGPAMTQEEVLKAIEVGIETARDLVAAGNKALLTGEMGIANTTTSAALIAVYTGVDPVEVTGRGTGINDETHARKVDVVRRALELHQPDPADPVGVLAAIGGLEHAAMVGLILGGASLRTPVILDGVSAGAAALVARAIAPEALAACIAGHRSAEPGHVAALNKLGLRPLVDLDLRLGEGTGALLALPLVQSAARAMHEVATFDSAGVSEKS